MAVIALLVLFKLSRESISCLRTIGSASSAVVRAEKGVSVVGRTVVVELVATNPQPVMLTGYVIKKSTPTMALDSNYANLNYLYASAVSNEPLDPTVKDEGLLSIGEKDDIGHGV